MDSDVGMYVCVYMYTYIQIYITHMYIHMRIYIYIYTDTYIRLCVHSYTHASTHLMPTWICLDITSVQSSVPDSLHMQDHLSGLLASRSFLGRLRLHHLWRCRLSVPSQALSSCPNQVLNQRCQQICRAYRLGSRLQAWY